MRTANQYLAALCPTWATCPSQIIKIIFSLKEMYKSVHCIYSNIIAILCRTCRTCRTIEILIMILMVYICPTRTTCGEAEA